MPSTAPDRPQQVGEERAAAGQVAPVGVDVLAEQGHLGDAPAGQGLDLGHQVVERSGHLAAPHRRDDAEGTRVVASGLDGHPGGIGQVPHGGQGGHLLIGAGRVGLRRAARPGSRPPGPTRAAWRSRAGGPGQVVGAEDHVDVGGPLPDPLPVHLGQAPAHRDLHVGPALPERLEVAQVAVELVVGVLPDAAGVEHHHVGRLEVGGGHQAVGHQGPGQPLRVVLVHLAPEGPDVEGAGRGAGSTATAGSVPSAASTEARRRGGHGSRIRPPRWSGRPATPTGPSTATARQRRARLASSATRRR